MLSLADIKSSTFGKASALFYSCFSSVLVISMHRNKYLYYLADKASTSFDKNEIGQSTKERIFCKNLMAVSSGSKFVNTPPPSWC